MAGGLWEKQGRHLPPSTGAGSTHAGWTYLSRKQDGRVVVLLMVIPQLVVLVLPLAKVLERGGRVLAHLQALVLVTQHHHLHHGQADVVLDAGMAVQPVGDGGQGQQVMLQAPAVHARHGRVSHQEKLDLAGPGDGAAPPPPPRLGSLAPVGGGSRLVQELRGQRPASVWAAVRRGALARPWQRCGSLAASARRQGLKAETLAGIDVQDPRRPIPVHSPGLCLGPGPAQQRLQGVARVLNGEEAVETTAEVKDSQGAGAAVHCTAVEAMVPVAAGRARPASCRHKASGAHRTISLQVQEEPPAARVDEVAHLAAAGVDLVDVLHQPAAPALRRQGVRVARRLGPLLRLLPLPPAGLGGRCSSPRLPDFILGRCRGGADRDRGQAERAQQQGRPPEQHSALPAGRGYATGTLWVFVIRYGSYRGERWGHTHTCLQG